MQLAAAFAVLAGACGALPSLAGASATLEEISRAASSVALRHAEEGPTWARAAYTSGARAIAMLGLDPKELGPGPPARVAVVLMQGSFTFNGNGGRYLAFVFWRDGETSTSAGFRIRDEPLPLKSVGPVKRVELSWGARHPEARGVLTRTADVSLWTLPPLALLLVAGLCLRFRRRWPYRAALAVLAATALLQIVLVIRSIFGGLAWDWAFHGFKVGVLFLVLAVEAVAGYLVAPVRVIAGDDARGRLPSPVNKAMTVGLAMMVVAALLYVVALPWLLTTGR